MAKRISAFTKEHEGLDNKTVLKTLEGIGITGKTAASNISEEEEALLLKALAGSAKAEAPKAATPAPKKEAESVAPQKEEKAEARKAEAVSEAKPAASNAQPPKKKKVIIVSSGNGNQGGSRPNPNNNRNGGGSYHPQNQGGNQAPNNARPTGPIRPRDNMKDRAGIATDRRIAEERAEEERIQAEERAKEMQRAQAETKPVVAETETAPQQPIKRPNIYDNKPRPNQGGFNNNRPNNQGPRPNQGGFNNNRNGGNQGGGKPGFGGNRPGGQGGKPGFGGQGRSQGGSKPVAETIIVSTDNRYASKKGGKDKDRNRKDRMYEDDYNVTQSRNFKAGAFQKPVKEVVKEDEDEIKVIVLPETLTIKELAEKMKMQPGAIVKSLFMKGEMMTVNSEITFEKAEEIAIEYEIMCEPEEKVDVIAELLKEEEEPAEKLKERPPVICVMGHVDHGKTSLLDAIRKTNVTDREAGGITQHIGAYTVDIDGRKITFLDTPGHEAFTSMRMRGANSTDIAILVVAADDGVMPQTVEAINHAKAAGVELIVAVNKIDKPSANLDRVKKELAEYELIPEDWGGSTVFCPVSAKTGEGIPELLEMILLSADVMELKANPNRRARGLVIEAELDKGRGPVATVLVQKGTLHVGDFISAGVAHGKVRAMVDDKGRRVKEAGPSTPVEILGLDDVPNAGEIFICHGDDKEAKRYADTFIAQNKAKLVEETKQKMSLDDVFSKIQEGNLKELNLIIKADVQGSVEAVKQSMLKLSNDEVVVKVIHGGVGAINESDVILASASSAIIIGFNVRPDAQAKTTAEREGVDVRLYRVIYQAIEDVEAAMKGLLDPIYEEKIIGHAEVRQIFKASQVGNIAGSFVLDGEFQRNCKIRITREGEQIYEGSLASLKRFKDDVKEVKAGFECGLVFEDFDKMQEFDIVEAYIMVEVPRT